MKNSIPSLYFFDNVTETTKIIIIILMIRVIITIIKPTLTRNLTLLKKNFLFHISSTPCLVFYSLIIFISYSYALELHVYHTYIHYIMNSHNAFDLNLRIMAWSHQNVIHICCFSFLIATIVIR